MAMKPVFHISQTSPLIDTQLEIRISNLLPQEVVTLKAEMLDNLGVNWESFATFASDSKGQINLATAQPLQGTYDTPDINGLFWSMSPILAAQPKERTPLKPLETKLLLMKGQELVATASIIRKVVSSKVHRISIRENGLVGTFFFHPSSGPLPTVIVLGGSEGGLRESNAALLASYGFNTLALAYFGTENLPEKLVDIPLDYMEKAIDWLSNHPNVDSTNLGAFGTSKGGELGLLLASIFPAIKAVVGYVPSGVVYPGLGPSPVASSWQYKGRSLPFACGKIPQEVTAELNQVMHTGAPISWRKTYLNWAEGEEQAEIAVENINGPILLISGGDDQLWPADLLSEKVIARLKRHKHPYFYKHINYPKAGHSFAVPGLPTSQSVTSPYGQGSLLLGGTPKDNAYAQFDAWQRTVDFFRESLNLPLTNLSKSKN